MAQKKNQDEIFFVPVDQKINDNIFQGGSYSLSLGYVDYSGKVAKTPDGQANPGTYVEYVVAVDPKKGPIAKRFQFNQSLGRLKTRMNDISVNGIKQYDFLKNHPECEGSPNGVYEKDSFGNEVQTNITFREANAAKDAETAIKIERLVSRVSDTVLALDEITLTEVANVAINYFGDADDFMKLKVLEWAKKKPNEFEKLMRESNRGYLAVIRKGIDEGIFTGGKNFGGMVKLGDTVIGGDELEAVAWLRKNPDAFEAAKTKLGFNPVDTKKK